MGENKSKSAKIGGRNMKNHEFWAIYYPWRAVTLFESTHGGNTAKTTFNTLFIGNTHGL